MLSFHSNQASDLTLVLESLKIPSKDCLFAAGYFSKKNGTKICLGNKLLLHELVVMMRKRPWV